MDLKKPTFTEICTCIFITAFFWFIFTSVGNFSDEEKFSFLFAVTVGGLSRAIGIKIEKNYKHFFFFVFVILIPAYCAHSLKS